MNNDDLSQIEADELARKIEREDRQRFVPRHPRRRQSGHHQKRRDVTVGLSIGLALVACIVFILCRVSDRKNKVEGVMTYEDFVAETEIEKSGVYFPKFHDDGVKMFWGWNNALSYFRVSVDVNTRQPKGFDTLWFNDEAINERLSLQSKYSDKEGESIYRWGCRFDISEEDLTENVTLTLSGGGNSKEVVLNRTYLKHIIRFMSEFREEKKSAPRMKSKGRINEGSAAVKHSQNRKATRSHLRQARIHPRSGGKATAAYP